MSENAIRTTVFCTGGGCRERDTGEEAEAEAEAEDTEERIESQEERWWEMPNF